ncbi:MAG: hypothetical protein HYV46_15305 [candidate division NC10 bacterium]|nr:hypothetical protein [candidate division NC10 bacterium]
MSRSRKKTPIGGTTTARSEKHEKRLANRKARRHVRVGLATDSDRDVLPHLREVSNVWTMAKDGKRYFDPHQYPKEMRK